MAPIPLTDVQYLNYTILSIVRDAARQDVVAACCRFGLTLSQLRTISELTPDAVMSIVARMGSEALFAPRSDLASLLTLPASVSPVLACARTRIPAMPAHAQPVM